MQKVEQNTRHTSLPHRKILAEWTLLGRLARALDRASCDHQASTVGHRQSPSWQWRSGNGLRCLSAGGDSDDCGRLGAPRNARDSSEAARRALRVGAAAACRSPGAGL